MHFSTLLATLALTSSSVLATPTPDRGSPGAKFFLEIIPQHRPAPVDPVFLSTFFDDMGSGGPLGPIVSRENMAFTTDDVGVLFSLTGGTLHFHGEGNPYGINSLKMGEEVQAEVNGGNNVGLAFNSTNMRLSFDKQTASSTLNDATWRLCVQPGNGKILYLGDAQSLHCEGVFLQKAQRTPGK